MPSRALRPCGYPGCSKLTNGGRCPDHASKPWAERRTEKQRVRGRALQERRARWFAEHPLCGDRVSGSSDEHSNCVRIGRATAATILDHIVPLARDGADVPANWQSLCGSCHDVKTVIDRGPGG